jgi:ribonuclease HIII
MHKEIENYLSHLLPLLMQKGVEVLSQTEIAWGVQLRVSRGTDRANINIYHSAKRGLSKVLGAPRDSGLKQELDFLLNGEKTAETFAGFHNWHCWIGSDECGKGDYFGPLVGSAFYVEAGQVADLRRLGVQDSKHLNDVRIVQIAKQIYLKYPNQASCIVLKPGRYNELIAEFKKQGQNLNDLLTWVHEKVILELVAKQNKAEGIVVDQFSKAQKVKSRIYKRNPALNVVERTGGERDVAVAAASILARYQFLEALAMQERKFKFSFPKGAGPKVIIAGQKFINEQGDKHLADVAKLHFKTSSSLKTTPSA